ncbi:MAG TPA: alpha-2-macroglobulin, partial [Polyangia bacterium]|nr:alpha-2-macroglobulin [Polyangia bacterium]
IDFPAALTRGDSVEFPIAVYNYLTEAQTVHLELQPGDWYTATGATTLDVPLGAGQVTGVRFPVRVDSVGRQTLTVKAYGTSRSDAVARSVQVDPDGKAIPTALSGSLAAGTVSQQVTFPAEAIAGSQKLSLSVFPAYLSQVVQGMDSLLRVPNGCFEQTTSTAWPNVLVTDYLKQTNQLKPEIQLKAESLMSAGYQRLLTFEHKTGGFSWFGDQDPMPYLSVTAFGLMEFADMSKVQTVDQAMVDRTRVWMLSQQASDGSWAGDRSEFFTFQTSLLRNTAFVVWALASTGYQGPELAKGLGFVKAALAGATPDAYTLGIVANAYMTASPADPMAQTVLDQLAALAKVDGDKVSWDTAGTQTNFYGYGNDGAVTSTAVAAQALLLSGARKDLVDGALAFLTGSRDANGNFGSTQATIWTLRALLLAAKKGTDSAVGTLAVAVDGTSFASVPLTADQSDVMTTVDMATMATTGTHAVTLTFVGTGKVSYNLVAQHNIPWAMMAPPPAGPLTVTVGYDKTTLLLDDTAQATVTVRNNTKNAENMILVTVGVPPGFSIATEDLDAYKTNNVLSAYEITGKQLMLYVTALPAQASQAFAYHLRASMPVRASDGGAEAFLYYQPDQRSSAPATILSVQAGLGGPAGGGG